eukprot:1361845-Pyramimonas_sp.AAC.1
MVNILRLHAPSQVEEERVRVGVLVPAPRLERGPQVLVPAHMREGRSHTGIRVDGTGPGSRAEPRDERD